LQFYKLFNIFKIIFLQCDYNKSSNQIFVQRFSKLRQSTVSATEAMVGTKTGAGEKGGAVGSALGIAATISLDWFVLNRARNVVLEIGTQQT